MNLTDKVERCLDSLRPMLRSDGGDVELVEVKDNKVYIKLRGACQGCPSSTITLKQGITVAIRRDLPEIEEVVEILPDGSMRSSTPDSADPWSDRRRIETVKLVIAVASGKGGVGKSTVAVNLALALKGMGLKIGLLDADIYGPSTPTMLGPGKAAATGSHFIQPAEAFGIKFISIGFFVEADSPMIWRGPMVTKAVEQFLHQTIWGVLDCLVIDLPPGTGDAQLTMAQKVPVDGVVIVTTPSDVALIDARRGLQMFKKIDVPVLGIVENMSYFICPHCNGRTDVFSAGGGRATAGELGVELLGEIPLDPLIRSTGDHAQPIVVSEPHSPQAQHFVKLAERVWTLITAQVPAWDKIACHNLIPAPKVGMN